MTSILGAMSPAAFLRDHWQKRPLLLRQAFPGFRGIIAPDAFLKLATRGDARSRLVIQHPRRRGRGQWERHDGPFGGLDRGMLPASHWTLLVNGLESLVPGGWDILNAFSFIPAARVDDLMVSYATDGGTVGPHDDLYDVFLLQGPGRRRWQVSTQADRSPDPDAAIKVLKNFVPEEEWLLEPGDMLYLPPGVAHFGVAEGPCFTYSIGFLAPTHAELVESFLGYLGAARAAAVDPDARYEDPDLKLQREPLEVSDAMVERIGSAIGELSWDSADVSDFLGRFLTRPKPRALFRRPARPMTMTELARRLRAKRGQLTLALPTRGLLRSGRLYVNGEACDPSPSRRALPLLRQLFRQRTLPFPVSVDERTLGFLHDWYVAGVLELR